MLVSLFLHSWSLHIPIPTPSWVGFWVANAMIGLLLMVLGMFLPVVTTITGIRLQVPTFYIAMVSIPVGLDILHIWGNIGELPIDLLWSIGYIAFIAYIRLGARRLKRARAR